MADGGEPREDQIEALEGSGMHLLVATTGRLSDMLQSRHVVLTRCSLVVLDEADQLLVSTTQRHTPSTRLPTWRSFGPRPLD